MDPQTARSKADDLDQKADKMKQEAEELRSDADEREQKIQRLRDEIAEKAEEERQARHVDDRDKEVELTRELRSLEAELRAAQKGGASFF